MWLWKTFRNKGIGSLRIKTIFWQGWVEKSATKPAAKLNKETNFINIFTNCGFK